MFKHPSQLAAMSRQQLEQQSSDAVMSQNRGGRVLCRILGKYLCYIDPENTDITPHLVTSGYWESWITQAIARLVQPGWNCIDTGANMGYYTLLLADLVGGTGKVLAVEPHPEFANLLCRSVNVNAFSNTYVVQVARQYLCLQEPLYCQC